MSKNKEIENNILDIIKQKYEINSSIRLRVSTMVECLSDENQINKLDNVVDWFETKVEECPFEVEQIPLDDVKGWYKAEHTGNIVHESKGFFSIIGVRTFTNIREVSGSGWDQPMVDQGTKSSLVGILRKNINDFPHYLLEAKAEPGNWGTLQLSPTLQATFSNLHTAHKGNKPNYAEYFEENTGEELEYSDCLNKGNQGKYNLLYRQWLPEDGGRFFKKRVLFKLVEVDESERVKVLDNFIWITLFQIKELLKRDNIVNPHVRSIIAHL